MTYQEIQEAIVACMPSKSLRAAVARTGHVFAPQELLALAYRYAPDQAKKLALLTLLEQGVPENALFAVRFLCDVPIVVSHKTHEPSYRSSVNR